MRENVSHRGKTGELEYEISKLSEQAADAQQALQVAENSQKILRSELEVLKKEAHDSRSHFVQTVAILQQRQEQYKAHIELLQSGDHEITAVCNDMDSSLSDAERMLCDAEIGARKIVASAGHALDGRALSNKALSDAQNALEEQGARLASLRSETQRLGRERGELELARASAQSGSHEKEKEIEGLKAQVETLKSEVVKLGVSLEESRSQKLAEAEEAAAAARVALERTHAVEVRLRSEMESWCTGAVAMDQVPSCS